jgi:hypothetical protein
MSVSYTLRLPDDLKRLIDSAASSGGVSTAQLVVDALWKYLERKPYDRVRQQSDPPATIYDSKPEMITVTPSVKANDAMSAFLSRLPGVAPVVVEQEETEPLRSCVECDKGMVSKYIKGRGMVFACTDNSCPMYGLESM